jgi:hypothetical protein
MFIFGVKPGLAGHFVEVGQNRQEKTGQKSIKNAQEMTGNLQKCARFEQKLTRNYHFLQINILLNWEKWGVL